MFEQYNEHSFELIYSTFPDEDSAARVGEALVQSHLAACVNIIPGMKSIYRWEGKIQSDQEVVLIAKTRTEKRFAAQDYIVHHHPNKVPAVISMPIVAGHEPYLDWLIKETL